MSTVPAELTNPENVSIVIQEISEISKTIGNPSLVVFDTLNRNFGSGDENSTSDMSAVIQSLDLIRSKCGSSIMVVHHTGHTAAGRARGSSAFYAALDTEFLIEKSDGLATVTMTKSKDAPAVLPETFELRTVYLGIYDDENNEISSAVLQGTDRVPEIKQSHGKWQSMGIQALEKNPKGIGSDKGSYSRLERRLL